MGRHLEAAQLEEPEPAPFGVGAEQLVDAQFGPVGAARYVDQKVPEQAVDQPGRRRGLLATGHAVELGEGDLELVEALVAGLVDPGGLAGRADEAAGEEVRERRVVLPVGDDAAEQVGPAQQGAVGGCRAAEGQVVAPAGAGVGAVEMERLGAEPGGAGLGVDARGDVDQLRPRRGRLDVDLEDARVGGDQEPDEPGVDRWQVALEDDRPPEPGGGAPRPPRRGRRSARAVGPGAGRRKGRPAWPRRTAHRVAPPRARPPWPWARRRPPSCLTERGQLGERSRARAPPAAAVAR